MISFLLLIKDGIRFIKIYTKFLLYMASKEDVVKKLFGEVRCKVKIEPVWEYNVS